MTTKQSYVYIIYCRELGTIKIGYSDNPFARLCQLQMGNSSELSILSIFKGGRDEELTLHKKLATNKVRGEWFVLDDSLMQELLAYQADTIAKSTGVCETDFVHIISDNSIYQHFDALGKLTQKAIKTFEAIALEAIKLAGEYAPAEKLDILACRLKLIYLKPKK